MNIDLNSVEVKQLRDALEEWVEAPVHKSMVSGIIILSLTRTREDAELVGKLSATKLEEARKVSEMRKLSSMPLQTKLLQLGNRASEFDAEGGTKPETVETKQGGVA